MIMGMGIDIVKISRISAWLDNEGICARYFQYGEMELVKSRGKGAACSLAGRFAAKEAFIKALGQNFSHIGLKEIGILNDYNSKPCIFLEGRAKEAMAQLGAVKAHVSLAHEASYAVANVILEG